MQQMLRFAWTATATPKVRPVSLPNRPSSRVVDLDCTKFLSSSDEAFGFGSLLDSQPDELSGLVAEAV
jgi:hypothetical protein